MNKSRVFKRAWNYIRAGKAENMSEALKRSWAVEKAGESTRFEIKDWFMQKNSDKFLTAHCFAFPQFDGEYIVKESAKAILVNVMFCNKRTGEESFRKNVWIPKSCVVAH